MLAPLLVVVNGCGEAIPEGAPAADEAAPDAGAERWTIRRTEAVRDAVEALRVGDRELATRLIGGSLRDGPANQTFFSAAECDPDLVRFLLDDLHLDPNARGGTGSTVIHELTFYEGRHCETPAETIEVLLDAGADPCASPDHSPNQVPALEIERWNEPPEVVALVRRASCT